ncbi:MAG: hypothetical protein RL651_480 [Pseudomonadota bacterium]|jgi:hypothetical protein
MVIAEALFTKKILTGMERIARSMIQLAKDDLKM